MITAADALKLVRSPNVKELHLKEINDHIVVAAESGVNTVSYWYPSLLPQSIIDGIIESLKSNGYKVEKSQHPTTALVITW